MRWRESELGGEGKTLDGIIESASGSTEIALAAQAARGELLQNLPDNILVMFALRATFAMRDDASNQTRPTPTIQ